MITPDLLMGTTPHGENFKTLKDLNVGLIINMRAEHRPLKPPDNIQFIWLPNFDSKYFPIRPKHLINTVTKANQILDSYKKLYIYCRAGRHRSLVMTAAILISRGYTAEAAINLITSKRQVADPEAEHIKRAVFDFESYWHSRLNA
jgi:rhodanese-related sulfurtransferase